jgi:selenide,water dikinase
MGEIAAAHAMSDVFAKGGTPDHGLAIAVLPHAGPRQCEDDLVQLMAGARAVFDAEGVALVGGHSGEGREMSIGFFISGSVEREYFVAKRGLRCGDKLILTKPLGTGILFAAWMRAKVRAREISAALASMRQTNAAAARILARHGVTAATDVTGFGLAGHLIELLEASDVAARVAWSRVPLLPGAQALADLGIGSTLLPENLGLAAKVGGLAADDRRLAILFDPQTSGGLLAGVPADRADACVAALAVGGHTAAIIGDVVTRDGVTLLALTP